MSTHVSEIKDVQVNLLKSNPPVYAVGALGVVPSSGWTNPVLAPRFYAGGVPADGVIDFDFLASPPKDFANWVMTPIVGKITLQGLPDSIKGVRIHAAGGSSIERMLKDFNAVEVSGLDLDQAIPFGFGIDPRGNITLRNWRFEGDSLVVDAEISASVEVDYILRKDKILDIQRTETIRIKIGSCYSVFSIGILSLEACYNPPRSLCVKLTANLSVWSGTLTEYCVDVPI